MAMTVNPAVSGTRRNWFGHSLAFLVGAFLGAVASITAVYVLERLVALAIGDQALALVVAGVIGLAVLADLGFPIPLPYRKQQVPEHFRDIFPPSVVASFFGFMLGVGFLTLFTYSIQLAFLLAVPLAGGPGWGLAAAAAFAAGKTVVLGAAAGIPGLGAIGPRFHTSRRRLRVLKLTTAAVSTFLVATLVSTFV